MKVIGDSLSTNISAIRKATELLCNLFSKREVVKRLKYGSDKREILHAGCSSGVSLCPHLS